jgi:hypothetical protein
MHKQQAFAVSAQNRRQTCQKRPEYSGFVQLSQQKDTRNGETAKRANVAGNYSSLEVNGRSASKAKSRQVSRRSWD